MYNSYNSSSAGIGFFLIFWLVLNLMIIGLYVLQSMMLQKLANQRGRTDGIYAWLPIFNIYLLCELTGRDFKKLMKNILLGLIPFVGMFFIIKFVFISLSMIYEILKENGINLGTFIIGFFIPPILIATYYVAYKNIKNNPNRSFENNRAYNNYNNQNNNYQMNNYNNYPNNNYSNDNFNNDYQNYNNNYDNNYDNNYQDNNYNNMYNENYQNNNYNNNYDNNYDNNYENLQRNDFNDRY